MAPGIKGATVLPLVSAKDAATNDDLQPFLRESLGEHFGRALTIAEVFSGSTVAELFRAIARSRGAMLRKLRRLEARFDKALCSKCKKKSCPSRYNVRVYKLKGDREKKVLHLSRQ